MEAALEDVWDNDSLKVQILCLMTMNATIPPLLIVLFEEKGK